MARTGGGIKAGTIASTSKVAKSNKQPQRSNKSNNQSYEEEELEEDEEEEEQFDATQDDDPVSTIELAAVLKAFSKGKNKKAADGSKIIEKQIRDLIDSTNETIDSFISIENQKCDKLVDSLNLDDEGISREMDPITYANLLHEFKQENSNIIDTLDTFVEHYNPENNEQYRKIMEQLNGRNHQAKKTHKKLVKSLRKQESEQLAMAEMNAETGPIIYKHLKAIARV